MENLSNLLQGQGMDAASAFFASSKTGISKDSQGALESGFSESMESAFGEFEFLLKGLKGAEGGEDQDSPFMLPADIRNLLLLLKNAPLEEASPYKLDNANVENAGIFNGLNDLGKRAGSPLVKFLMAELAGLNENGENKGLQEKVDDIISQLQKSVHKFSPKDGELVSTKGSKIQGIDKILEKMNSDLGNIIKGIKLESPGGSKKGGGPGPEAILKAIGGEIKSALAEAENSGLGRNKQLERIFSKKPELALLNSDNAALKENIAEDSNNKAGRLGQAIEKALKQPLPKAKNGDKQAVKNLNAEINQINNEIKTAQAENSEISKKIKNIAKINILESAAKANPRAAEESAGNINGNAGGQYSDSKKSSGENGGANIGLMQNNNSKNDESNQKFSFNGGKQFKEFSDNKEMQEFFRAAESSAFEKAQSGETKRSEAKSNRLIEYREVRLAEFAKKTLQIAKNNPKGGVQKARLYLTPKSLGAIIVELNVSSNKASLKIKAGSNEALKAIEAQIPELKDKLFRQGLQTENVEVKLRNEENEMFNQGAGFYSGQERKEEYEARQDFARSFRKPAGSGTESAPAENEYNETNDTAVPYIKGQGSSFERYV